MTLVKSDFLAGICLTLGGLLCLVALFFGVMFVGTLGAFSHVASIQDSLFLVLWILFVPKTAICWFWYSGLTLIGLSIFLKRH